MILFSFLKQYHCLNVLRNKQGFWIPTFPYFIFLFHKVAWLIFLCSKLQRSTTSEYLFCNLHFQFTRMWITTIEHLHQEKHCIEKNMFSCMNSVRIRNQYTLCIPCHISYLYKTFNSSSYWSLSLFFSLVLRFNMINGTNTQ